MTRKLATRRLKITSLPDNKPVKITVEVSASLHGDLLAYSEILARETEQPSNDLARLMVAMVMRFIATDRAFTKLRKVDLSERQRKGDRA